jgi:hypothetical protein
MPNCRWETVSTIIERSPVGTISLSYISHLIFHSKGHASNILLKHLEHFFIIRLSGNMIVVAPDPSLDEIYPIDSIDWGGLIIACSVELQIGTPNVILEIEPNESKDIRVFIMVLRIAAWLISCTKGMSCWIT